MATLPGTSAALIHRSELSQPLDLQARLAPVWPGEVFQAVTETLKDVKVSERGNHLAVQTVGDMTVLLQGVGERSGPPDAWLCVARTTNASESISEEQEVLARMAQVLSRVLSRAVFTKRAVGPESGGAEPGGPESTAAV
jgi:hypothetical protein